jgi:signal transduction histidine kinase
MSTRNLSVKRKLILLQLLVVFAVLVLHSVFLFLNDARIYRQTVSTKLVSMANMIGYNSTSALNFQDAQDATKTLNSLEAEIHVTHAWILDASDRIFAVYRKPGRNSEQFLVKGRDYEEVTGRTLILSRRILQDREVIGSVILRYELDSYPTILLRDARVFGLALLGGMGIALLLALLTHRVLSAPVLCLVETIRCVSQTKDLSIRIGEQRQDEFGVLYQGFNDMLAEIRELNETLERRVEERTRELAVANERLIELDRMKSMFLASMSHELRTPLNSILGFTGLLLMGMSGDLNEEQIKQLTMVKNSSMHLLALINDILDISKIESGKVELMIEPFPIAEVTNEILKAVTPLAKAKSLNLVMNVPDNLILQSDRRRFKQVLMNLLSNAIKFSDQGSISVTVGVLGEDVSVSISDCGIGIRNEDIEKLFNPFRQIDMSSTKQHEGTGLGLYLCKKILALIHGAISVKSEYGRGSTFTFILPMKQKENLDEESAHH